MDIVKEQQRSKHSPGPKSSRNNPQPVNPTYTRLNASNASLEARIDELLSDGKGVVNAEDPDNTQEAAVGNFPLENAMEPSENFAAQDSYHLRLIAPQIQLQSEKNSDYVVLATGKEMELRIVQIMDKDRISDDVSGLVQRRFSLDMDGVQSFVAHLRSMRDSLPLDVSAPYGASIGSEWPPWAPLETNFDFESTPMGWIRVVQKTSASLQYDKYNNLRLKYNSEVTKDNPNGIVSHGSETRIDHLWVSFPHVRAICDSSQFYALYAIVLDLLLYNEPMEKVRSEKFEKIMLAADFSDLTGSPEMVTNLQGGSVTLRRSKPTSNSTPANWTREGDMI